MELKPEQQNQYAAAKKKAREIRSFYINLACYILVITMLGIINLVYMPEFLWFIFSAIGWGIGLIFHAIGAFGNNLLFGKKWEERKIQELLDKEKSKTS